MTQSSAVSVSPRASLDRVLDALSQRDCNPRRQGGSHKALCPVHGEVHPSLNVTWTPDNGGMTLVHCHACHAGGPEVADALGLTLSDFYDTPLPPREHRETGGARVGRSPQQRRTGARRGRLGPLPKPIVAAPSSSPATASDVPETHEWVTAATYPYLDASGEQVQLVFREQCACEDGGHKQFRQVFVVRDGRGATKQVATKPKGFEPVLYRHPQVLAAVSGGVEVWLLEGEKDVETAERLGLVATTNTQGGLSFPEALARVFTDATVTVVLDRDGTGYERGVRLHALLTAVGATVRLMLPATTAPKSDFTDHVEAGLDLAALIEVHVDELVAWSAAAQIVEAGPRALPTRVDQARAEALAQWAAADTLVAEGRAPRKVEEHRRFAHRWAQEGELRCQQLSDRVGEIRAAVQRTGTEWAVEALESSAERLAATSSGLRGAFETLGLPLPPLLQPAEESPQAAADAPEEPDARVADQHGEPSTDPSPATAGGEESAPVDPVALGLVAPMQPRSTGQRAVRAGSTELEIDQPTFRIVQGSIVMVDRNAGGRRRRRDEEDDGDSETLKLILASDVRIVEMEYREQDEATSNERHALLGRASSAEQERLNPTAPAELAAVTVAFTHPDTREEMRLRVDVEQWRDGSWLDSLPGQPDYDAKPSGLALIRRAIKGVSPDIKTTHRYQWTGWRFEAADSSTVDGDDVDAASPAKGSWRFIHARGAITAAGNVAAPVLLTGPLGRYDLPDPNTDASFLRQAFLESSAAFLDRMPDRVAAPLLGHVYRSALGVNPWVLALIGSPGSYKTSVASLAMHHWGELWDRSRPGTSMSGNGATLNALRIQLNRSKDALFWADDVAPTKDWGLAQKTLEEFARMVHNAEERVRAERSGQGVLDGTVPRASAMVTSEVMPRPGSGSERILVVPFSKENMVLENLIHLDDPTRRHHRARLMSSFLSWLAADLTGHQERMRAEVQSYASDLRGNGEAVRRSEAMANTWAGWVLMCEYLQQSEAITSDEVDTILVRVDRALREALEAAVDPDLPSRTGARVRELLAHALRSGLAYVDDVQTGECPDWPLAGRLGWRRMQVGSDEIGAPRYRYEGRGIKLGWVTEGPDAGYRTGDDDLSGRHVFVESTAALEAILQTTAKSMTDAPQLDRGTAVRALYDEGILLAEARSGHATPRYTVQRSIPCEQRRQRVTALRLDLLLGVDDPDESSGPDGAGGRGPGDGPEGPGGPGGTDGDPDPLAVGEQSALPLGEAAPAEGAGHTGVDALQRSAVASQMPPRGLASPTLSEEETRMQIYSDLDGNAVRPVAVEQEHVGPCLVCTKPCMVDFAGQMVHIPCWEKSSAAQRREAARALMQGPAAPLAGPAESRTSSQTPRRAPNPNAAAASAAGQMPRTTPIQPDQVAANASPAEPPRERPRRRGATSGSPTQGQPGGQPGGFLGSAAVLDAEGLWLPGEEQVVAFDALQGCEEGAGLRHLGDVAHLTQRYRLGSQVRPTWDESGQIWVTAAAAARLGIDLDLDDLEGQQRKERNESINAQTAETAFVDDALAAGWRVGGKGASLGIWTRVWHDELQQKAAWVVLIPGMDDTEAHADVRLPLFADSPSPASLARRLMKFSDALRAPWVMTPSTTGLDLAYSLRLRDRERVFTPAVTVPPPALVNTTEGDINWSRVPTKEEAGRKWVHAYDRGGSYLAGTGSLELGIGEPQHHPEGLAFDKKLPGYWLVAVGKGLDWRVPHPLSYTSPTLPNNAIWVTTPTLQFALEQEYSVEVLEAWVWPEHARILDPWYERVRDARHELDQDDVDAQAARDAIKQVYVTTIGMMGSETYMKGRRGYAPDRRHHIVAKARTNILRKVAVIGAESDQWPVAITKDTIIYVSDEADPVKAWPGKRAHLGRGLGMYKPEGSAPLADHLQHLTGDRYRGKSALVPQVRAGDE